MPNDKPIADKLRAVLVPAAEPARDRPVPTDDELAAALQASTDHAARKREARRALAECEQRLRALLTGTSHTEGRELTLEGKITNALTAVVRAKDAI